MLADYGGKDLWKILDSVFIIKSLRYYLVMYFRIFFFLFFLASALVLHIFSDQVRGTDPVKMFLSSGVITAQNLAAECHTV